MIMRVWRGITDRALADDYQAHLRETMLPTLCNVPGLERTTVLRREQGDKCEFQVATLWHDIDAMRAWTGGDPEKAVYFDQDDHYLLDMQPLVRLYDVVDTVTPEY